jgi:hypothetical protein
MEPIPRQVDATRAAGHASGLARMEARRLGHHYLGAEHLLVGLLVHSDNLAARVLVAHGLELEAVRAEVDRLIDQGVLPRPQPGDGELLATLGVDLEAVHARLQATFGEHAYWEAAQPGALDFGKARSGFAKTSSLSGTFAGCVQAARARGARSATGCQRPWLSARYRS